jgi:hypothetical protein
LKISCSSNALTSSFAKDLHISTSKVHIIHTFARYLVTSITIMLQKLTSCGSSDNAFCDGSLENKLCRMSSVTWIFFYNNIFIFIFFPTLNLSNWNLFSFCYTLEFLCFLQGLLILAFGKIWKNENEHNLFYENPLCEIFTTHNQNLWACSSTIYVNCNCMCGLRCLKKFAYDWNLNHFIMYFVNNMIIIQCFILVVLQM